MATGSVHDKECVIIIGTYINACSIFQCLKKIDYQFPIVLIDPSIDGNTKCLADIWLKQSVIKKKIQNVEEITAVINDSVDLGTKKIILMTAEEFIDPIKHGIADGRLSNTISYTGSELGNEQIFNRFEFYRFIEDIEGVSVPKTIDYSENPNRVFGNDYIIRVKKSWEQDKKLPRLQIVHSIEEKKKVETEFIREGLKPQMWCYQELLSTLDTNNVSVCGWYDAAFKQYAVTRKLVQHPPKTGNGDVVEIFEEAPDSIVQATDAILEKLKYSGPFEMEFVFDVNSSEYKVIELNPRFWMQHGLVEQVTDQALVRRAVGAPVESKDYKSLKHRYWINGNQMLYRLAKGQVRMLKYMKNGTCYPPLRIAAKWFAFYHAYKRA